MANNPAFNRLEKDAQSGYAGFRTDPVGATHPASTGYAAPPAMTPDQLQEMYNRPPAGPVHTDRVTVDDVIMKSTALFGIVIVFAAVGWVLTAQVPAIGAPIVFGGMIATLILGLVIAFKKTLSVPLILIYAVIEGVFVGGVSQFYAAAFDPPGTPAFQGIVAQAVLATLATFGGMLLAYRTGLIKVTAKFRKIMTMALIGYALFAVVNFIYSMVTSTPFGIGGTGALGIGISVFAVGLAAFTLALDFDSIEWAIRSGAPQKYSWLLAHGLIVTLVWLYLEILRLIARLRSE
ncbi:MAG: Bax inhibitor-1/YccA family protein [Dermatophilaceae bacterium]